MIKSIFILLLFLSHSFCFANWITTEEQKFDKPDIIEKELLGKLAMIHTDSDTSFVVYHIPEEQVYIYDLSTLNKGRSLARYIYFYYEKGLLIQDYGHGITLKAQAVGFFLDFYRRLPPHTIRILTKNIQLNVINEHVNIFELYSLDPNYNFPQNNIEQTILPPEMEVQDIPIISRGYELKKLMKDLCVDNSQMGSLLGMSRRRIARELELEVLSCNLLNRLDAFRQLSQKERTAAIHKTLKIGLDTLPLSDVPDELSP